MWATNKDFSVDSLGDNQFIFRFNSIKDKRHILADGPWNYDDCLLALEEPKGMGEVSSLKFQFASFWAHLQNGPICCMNREMGMFLGNLISDIEDIDVRPSRDCLSKFTRVRVKLDITKPLLRGLNLIVEEGQNLVTVVTAFEILPVFCYNCGRIGHSLREYPELPFETPPLPKSSLKFGDCLKVLYHPSPNNPSLETNIVGNPLVIPSNIQNLPTLMPP